ncbi:MAG: DUF3090 family protein [Anaerolineae bacterium]|nr:DUF3090 family protein [Anaerolineae bacterium]MCB9104807.1 DUF3090 family protein [Anaerolineales bacterium]
MAKKLTDLNPVTRITIGAVGEPGQRIFLLQASQTDSNVTLKIEKEQARVLAVSTTELLDELDEKYPRSFSKVDRPLTSDLMLREPMEPEFVVGQIGLGYDQDQDMVVLVVQEIQADTEDDVATMRFWATRAQMKALSEHTLEVVNQGRPICPLCESPIDPEGHFCPKSNGFERVQWN